MKTNFFRTIGVSALSICALFGTYSTTAQSVNVIIPNTGAISSGITITHSFMDPLPPGAALVSASISGTVASTSVNPGFYSHLITDINTDVLGGVYFELTNTDFPFGPFNALTFTNYVYGGSNNFNYLFDFYSSAWKGATITLNYITSCNIAPPVITSVAATSNSTILVDWNSVVGANFYEIQYREKGTSGGPENGFTSNVVSNAVTSYPLTGLTPGTVYQVRVRSLCANSGEMWSTWTNKTYNVITNGPAACPETFIGGVVANSNTSFTISVFPPSAPLPLIVEIRSGDNSYQSKSIVASNGPGGIMFSGLSPSTTYIVKVTSDCDTATSFKGMRIVNKTQAVPMIGGTAERIGSVDAALFIPKSELSSARVSNVNANVYPNPARDILNLEVSTISENATATIISIDGKIMKVVSLNNNLKSEINVSDLSNGMYMIRIQNGFDVSTQRFVKN